MKTSVKKLYGISQSLNRVSPGFSSIYERRLSDFARKDEIRPAVEYTPLKIVPPEDRAEFISGLKETFKLQPHSNLLNLSSGKVLRPSINDIEVKKSDTFGQVMMFSVDDVDVRYTDSGKSPSKSNSPIEMLDKKLTISAGSLGVLNVAKHAQFLIDTKDDNKTFALGTCELEVVPNHAENIKRYSLNTAFKLDSDEAAMVRMAIEKRIIKDSGKEAFYEEMTSKVYNPTNYNRSSGTLMNFETENYYRNETTEMHYHPGERSLHIYTSKKPAGVFLNFCGPAENPEDRPDCEVHLKFPENSMLVLNFPPYTHHRFEGNFVCMSVHPREGLRLIEAAQSGTLPKNFLESATTFSSTKENPTKWHLSLPSKGDEDQTIDQSR